MPHILLLGAGFSRNWGGWLADEAFEYLLGHPLIMQDSQLKQILWKHKNTGGFENALAEIQTEHNRGVDQKNRLNSLQEALLQMFADMNNSFVHLPDFIPSLQDVLTKFDAIFTLNQDLLLESHYHCNQTISYSASGKFTTMQSTAYFRKWDYWQTPGIFNPEVTGIAPHKDQIYKAEWFPTDPVSFKIEDRRQPYFKLHGSCNWRDKEGGQLLVMGGDKGTAIRSHAVLKWYHEQFESYLSIPGTRLMIIGYGFRDDHINTALIQAAAKGGLQLFIIDPLGVDAIGQNNLTKRPGNIYLPDNIESALRPILIGGSRRKVPEIFGKDTSEYAKMMRFFN